MPLPTSLPAAILGRLALLFLSATAGDLTAARTAAAEMLGSYQPQTATELRLAANVISFSLHALEALSQAAHPDMSLTKVLRLRGSAVSLSRESHKAERHLLDLQQARCAGQPEPEAPDPTPPKVEKAITLIEATRQTIDAKTSAPIWSKAYRQQQAARRITENLQRNATAANAPPQ